MIEKLKTLVLSDSELDLIYDALEELRLCSDDEEESETISSIQDKIFEICKE